MCGSGKKLRKVTCVDTVTGQPIDDQLCEKDTKPRDSRRCSKVPCPYVWVTDAWTQVSERVHCTNKNGTIVNLLTLYFEK